MIRVSTGATTSCCVSDRGQTVRTRVIDLSSDTFALLAGPGPGLIEVGRQC